MFSRQSQPLSPWELKLEATRESRRVGGSPRDTNHTLRWLRQCGDSESSYQAYQHRLALKLEGARVPCVNSLQPLLSLFTNTAAMRRAARSAEFMWLEVTATDETHERDLGRVICAWTLGSVIFGDFHILLAVRRLETTGYTCCSFRRHEAQQGDHET